jgi:inositol 3-alpha-galactosyltransferase
MAVPRTLRTYLATALGFIVLSAIYLSYTHNLLVPARAGLVGHTHAELEKGEDIGLVFPNDPVPRRDFASLSNYPAHNINEPSKFAYATFYCTRQPDMRGPYFESTQSIIWRLLWSDYRSKYPVIVFVCPFIPNENRRIFRGQGAIVKEVELLDDIIPDEVIATKRWIDVLSKLNVWKEVEWKRIVFLDGDAFPINNIDDIFELVPEQQCKKEALSPQDRAVVDNSVRGEDMCNYVYAGVQQYAYINAGMLVLKPNLDMHAKLINAARSTQDYDVRDLEQGVLKSENAFADSGPFPVSRLPPVWNAVPEYYIKHRDEGLEATDGRIRIVHAKMWNRLWGEWNNLTALNDMWELDWMKMCKFYDDPVNGFVEARETGIYKTPWDRYLESQVSS